MCWKGNQIRDRVTADLGTRAALADLGTQADLGTPSAGRQVPPPKKKYWGNPQPWWGALETRTPGCALEALSLGGARKALNWTEPTEKVSWTGQA